MQAFTLAGTGRRGSAKSWWTVPAEGPEEPAPLPEARERGLVLLTQMLQLRDPSTYKCMVLSAVTLWCGPDLAVIKCETIWNPKFGIPLEVLGKSLLG
jgi:hypothetical protein